MQFKPFTVLAISCLIGILTWLSTPPALAVTQIKLFDLSYHDCPPEVAGGTLPNGSSTIANCFLIVGKAENPSGKMVVNADVFGRIYDAQGNSVMENRTRLGAIPEVPPGISDFEIRISVSANLSLPLELKQFKATGFTGKVRR
ncbi:hypothetical protein BCD67_09355 [Oscillatoriales cyanobacterium USR001]|nr:hypothetical protein BCD67_09355 [Oscillatoriales cyanobacterium USR001]